MCAQIHSSTLIDSGAFMSLRIATLVIGTRSRIAQGTRPKTTHMAGILACLAPPSALPMGSQPLAKPATGPGSAEGTRLTTLHQRWWGEGPSAPSALASGRGDCWVGRTVMSGWPS
jgi:hypothetical protein